MNVRVHVYMYMYVHVYTCISELVESPCIILV